MISLADLGASLLHRVNGHLGGRSSPKGPWCTRWVGDPQVLVTDNHTVGGPR